VEASEYAWPPARWQQYLRARREGEYSRPFICTFRGGDFGYIELYRAAKDSIAPRYDADPHDVALHAAIAELKFVNRGIGPMLLPRLVASVFELEPLCRRIMFDPDLRNSGAPAVRILRLRLPRRARHVEPPDGALRIAARPAERSAARDQGS
jgi:RimJ/RimL family protein N-acetyltransferase